MNCTGISSPDGNLKTPCIWIETASVNPNKRHASSVCTGRHLPKINAARAMKPRPAVIFLVNNDDWPIERYAPPIPARMPASSTPEYLMLLTLTPAASAASGFSPTDLSRSPKGVLYRTYQMTATSTRIAIAITIGDCGSRWSLGICGVEPDDRKNAPLRNPGIPIIRILMAAPLTTWSALNLIQLTA